MLTAESLADLRRLLDAGGGAKPWSVPAHDTSSVNDADGWCVASCNYGTSGGDHDAALIAAAVNALPALLDAAAERDVLAAKLDVVREWIDKCDALDAKLDAVREWIDKRGVNVSDRDDDYMRGYRAAQRHALQDAHDLRRALDADA